MHTLLDLVEQGASRVSLDKVAVQAGDGDADPLTFEGLIDGARGVAGALLDAGIEPGDRIGLWMEKSPGAVQAILGILYAGAAYVPLDPRSPWRRCRAIATDCQMAGLVVDQPSVALLGKLLSGWEPRLLVVEGPEGVAEAAAAAGHGVAVHRLEEAVRSGEPLPPDRPRADDPAYLLYTSGSTGTPKGVVHTHRSGVAFTRWILDRFAIRPDDVFSSHAPFHFDLSISDLFGALGAGSRVHLIRTAEAMLAPYLVRQVPGWGITVWYSVPSILMGMLDSGGLEEAGFGHVRLLFFAGEVFPTPQLRRLRRALPDVDMYNLFGPTETNVCTYYQVPDDIPDEATAPIPIGQSCEHMETFVMSDDGHEAGEGTEGTLWVRGDNLMREYWNDAERTAGVLRPDPRGRPGTAYCTGDRVRRMPDGDYRFLGRRDHMVKTRGYRVDLGEIESALAAHHEVLEAVALPLPDEKLGNRLVAVLVARAGCAPSHEGLRAFLAERLPAYMIPDPIEVRPALPRTSTGKADRRALLQEWSAKEMR